MENKEIKLKYIAYSNSSKMTANDGLLLAWSKKSLDDAYAPYSGFKVSASILLANGEIVIGTNQENAAFPAGLCAEATALSAASAMHPGVAIQKIAISAKSEKHLLNTPVAPCGICRQRIREYETRFGNNIEIILTGEIGEVFVFKTIKDLLPLSFSSAYI